MFYQFQILATTRENLFKLMDGLALRQLNHIPEGFSNNLLWNAGHILATQQLLLYNLSGQEVRLPEEFIGRFRKGTRPEGAYGQEEAVFIKDNLRSTAQQATLDYERGLFQEFGAYATSYGIKLNTIEEAIQFNNVHEGLHLGYMMAMRKRV